jgi:putative ABC transport system ATP-binding protein
MAPTPGLELSAVTRRFTTAGREVLALADCSLTLDAGTLTALQGPSGSGKTTLLLMAGALLRPSAGQVRVAGQEPYAMSAEVRAGFRARHIGFVFQQYHLLPYLNLLDNVLAPSLAWSRPKAAERARELLVRFGLGDRLMHVPSALSAGERQRGALARALLNEPALVLADEPTGNLDAASAQLILTELSTFAQNGGTVLMATHDPVAMAKASLRLRLDHGRLASPSEVTSSVAVSSA